MLTDLDKSIKQLLASELPIKNGEIDVKFEQPTREWSSRLSRPTVNFFLYDIRENQALRQHQWERLGAPPGQSRTHAVAQKRSPYRVDCHYMMTVWAAEAQDEHRLLTRSLLALLRYPLIPEKYLAGEMNQQPFPIQTRAAHHDQLTNPAEVWSALDNEMRPAVSYVCTVALDPWAEISGPAVRTLTLETGQAHTLPHRRRLVVDTRETMILIGGMVAEGDAPRAGVRVGLKGTGFASTTDDAGRYVLGSVPPGDYTLVVWPAEGPPTERRISVPNGDYDIQLP